MKFLLFFVSFIFSFIFYTFYNLSIWKDIYWNIIENKVFLQSLGWNLLIESFLFLFIWFFFLYIFSGIKWKEKFVTYKFEIIYFLYYFLFISYIYFFKIDLNLFFIILIIIFIFSDILFNHISFIKRLKGKKIILRYIWLLLNYISSLISFYFIYKNWLSFIPSYIILFNIIFNFFVHKRYINYISLFFSILNLFFIIYYLYFFIFDIYYSYN